MLPIKYNKLSEGQKVPHAHKDDALEYQYLDKDGETDIKANICSWCVRFDRCRGYIMERTFIEETPKVKFIDNWTYYPNPEEK